MFIQISLQDHPRMPLSSELQYNMSEHVNSPASLLGDYCVYLKIYPGGKSCGRGPRKGVSAYLVFAPIYDSGHLPLVFFIVLLVDLLKENRYRTSNAAGDS